MRPVRELMSAGVLSVTPSLSLRDALELFAARHIGGAPVVEGGKVIGVLSISDILSFQASTPAVPSLVSDRSVPEEEPPEEPEEGDEAPQPTSQISGLTRVRTRWSGWSRRALPSGTRSRSTR